MRELGYGPGFYQCGKKNSILDVKGNNVFLKVVLEKNFLLVVFAFSYISMPLSHTKLGLQVGQKTIHDPNRGIHVGVTIIYPRGTTETRLKPSYAAIHTLNGAGEMTGKHFIDEWGFTSSPIAFTDSMSIGAVYQSLLTHAWAVSRDLGESEEVGYSHFGWPVVGETWGGGVTDIHDGKSTLTYEQVVEAINDAQSRTEVGEGSQGGGAGMLCSGHKAGTGTSSRIVPGADGEDFVVGVLVQSNYGQKATLQVGGVPVGKLLLREEAEKKDMETAKEQGSTEVVSERGKHDTEGSKQNSPRNGYVEHYLFSTGIIIALITDAPLLPHQLRRLAARATYGLTAAGGHSVSYNTSGDIFIALSTSEDSRPEVLMKHEWQRPSPAMSGNIGGRPAGKAGETSGNGFRRLVETQSVKTVVHSTIDALFVAAAEATEEAILNSMCAAEDTLGWDGTVWKGLDCEKVRGWLDSYRVV